MNSVYQRKIADRQDWAVAYLNPNLINQSAINPRINEKDPMYKGKTPDELQKMKTDMTQRARTECVQYIFDCFMRWQNRNAIIALYNFE